MEDDNSREDHNQDSASKKHSEKNISGDDDGDSADGRSSNSHSTVSAAYSAELNMAHGQDVPQPTIAKNQKKREKKKKRPMATRVEKRKRPVTKRQVNRKMPKRKPRARGGKRVRDLSISTIFSRLSSNPTSQPLGCDYCGHRCCRRRYEYERTRYYQHKRKSKPRNQNFKRKKPQRKVPVKFSGAEYVQAGSRCMMLSPLCIDTNSTPMEGEEQCKMHCEVSPEMIEESLRTLTMWKQDVQTEIILEHLMRNYPVNSDKGALLEELLEKLRLAMIVGIVSQATNGSWSLSHAFQKRRLAKTHVSLFWKIYADTMKPVARIEDKTVPKPQEEKETNTRAMRFYDEKYI